MLNLPALPLEGESDGTTVKLRQCEYDQWFGDIVDSGYIIDIIGPHKSPMDVLEAVSLNYPQTSYTPEDE